MSNSRKLALPVALVLVVVMLPKLPPVRTAVLTAALVPEMLDVGLSPLSMAVAKPTRTTINYGTPMDRMDVYVPAAARPGARLPAVVLELGVHPQPIDDPTVVRLASAMSRLGLVVGVPDSTALRNLQVTPAEPGHLVDAVGAVSALPEVDPQRVGLAGFSAGASIALIAAADPRIADTVRFVSSFGGYADAERLLVDVATRTTLDESGAVAGWQPDPGIRHDVLELALNALDDPAALDALHAALDPIVGADPRGAGPPAPPTAFTGDAEGLYRLFTAADRATAEAAIESLSPDLQASLDGISPLHFADGIRAPVYLLHGVPDTAIPVAHAALLRDAIGDEVMRLTRFGRFGHGQPGSSGLGIDDMADIVQLTLYLRDIVGAATE